MSNSTGSWHEQFADMDDVRRIEATPFEARCSHRSVPDMIAARAAATPDAPALVWLAHGEAVGVVVDYRTFARNIAKTAAMLRRLGAGPGQGISILMPNMPETIYALWGAAAAGFANPINPLLSIDQIADIICATGSRILVTAGTQAAFDVHAKARALRERLPQIEHLVVVGEAAEDEVDFRRMALDQPADDMLQGRRIDPDEVSACFHTGGTTGTPKIARQSHRNQVFTAWTCAFLFDLSPADRILTGLPLFHANAAVATGLSAIMAGSSTLLCGELGYRDKGFVRNFWQVVEKWRPSMFSAVPTVYAALLETLTQGFDTSSLRFGFCGAAPMPPSLFRDFQDRTGLRIIEGYGMTESGALSSCNPRDGKRLVGSIGLRLPYQHCKPAILDEAGRHVRDCVTDEVGVLLLKGPNVFSGYLEPRHNEGVWAEAGWLQSGDLGRMDAEGYIWIAGRAKDLIIRGGHNIDPASIEEALQRHPDVEIVAALGRPDAYAGEVPIAYVKLAANASVQPEDLRKFAAAHVPEPPAAPVEVVVVQDMPVTAVGKIFKVPLRLDATQRALHSALSSAGIDASVEAQADDRSGIVAHIHVADEEAESAAAAILGRFAVSFRIIRDQV